VNTSTPLVKQPHQHIFRQKSRAHSSHIYYNDFQKLLLDVTINKGADHLDYLKDICVLAMRIEESVKSIVSYRDLEKTVGFSYRHLRDFFKKSTGISLSRYMLARKIANAAFEIRHSKKSITEIAFEYGFSNLDTFTRVFRRYTGLNPSGFKKSGYLCGRNIICPGVYAPVVLNLNNPVFTLQNIKEVNKMVEMQKTSDSCILYGVPKVYYGRIVDGQMQLTPFSMVLQAVLNYMGQNITYTQIMAASGAAFRQRFDSRGWNMGASDIRYIYRVPVKPFELAYLSAGRRYKICEVPDKSKAKDTYLEMIKSELDCGRPLIALGVVGPPEACIVTGYQNGGRTLLGWSLFQGGGPFDENVEIHETGYFIRENWWENTEAIMSIGEEIGTLTPVKEILKNALKIMTEENIETCGGSHLFYGGQAAYAAWAKTIEEDAGYAEGSDMIAAAVSHEEQESMLWEGRGNAAAYIGALAEQYPALALKFAECAGLLKSASECVLKMQSARDGQGQDEKVLSKFKERQTREQIAAFIREAAAYEKNACAVLEKIIGEL
jgi:AraC-like DNA-binding protein